MFYAHFVLSKKGPLARIWLAAHWDKKLTKAHVFETNIESSVEGILQPKVKMALRTSGHLLLGVVRIYSRKAKYLLADCNEAFIKIKMAFRPGVVDLPEENREAALNAITLPEVFHDFDTAMPDLTDIDVQAQFSLNQSRAEEITMREDYGNIILVGDDGFGDMGFEDAEMVREVSNMEDTLDQANLLFGDDKREKDDIGQSSLANSTSHSALDKQVDIVLNEPLRDDGFGGGVGDNLLSAEAGLFEPGGLFDDAPMEHVPMDTSGTDPRPLPFAKTDDKKVDDQSDDDDDFYGDMGPPSMGAPSTGPSSPASPALLPPNVENHLGDGNMEINAQPAADQTTLIHNEEETFALAPLDTTVIQGAEKAKGKRKRKLIVDEVKNISGEEMKSQLADTSDIVTTLDLAPPTKRLMHWKETGGVEKLFALPGRPIPSRTLCKLYQRHLTTRAVENEDFGIAAEEEILELEPENVREDDSALNALRTPRKRRHETEILPEQPPAKTIDTSALLLPEEPVVPAICEPHQPIEPVQMQIQPEDLPADIPPPLEVAAQPEPEPEQLVPIPPLEESIPEPQLQELVPPEQELQNEFVHPIETPVAAPVHVEPVDPVDDFFSQANQPNQKNIYYSEMQKSATPFAEMNHIDGDDLRPQPTPFMHGEDDDDMECPASVGPPEEQGADETYEQFEERVLNKRAQQMLYVIQRQFMRQDSLKFSDFVKQNTRKQVAQKFYTFLVLKKQQAVELGQEEAFSELIITRGPKLEIIY